MLQTPIEYRILALYRFVPLVVPDSHVDAQDGDGATDGDVSVSTIWDEAALMAHPEQHPSLRNLKSELYETLRKYEVRGTLLLAPEGINGTICYPFPPPLHEAPIETPNGPNENYLEGQINTTNDPVYSYLTNHPLFGGSDLRTRLSVWKEEDDENGNTNCDANNNITTGESVAVQKQPQPAFQRLKIKIKAEIVTMGLGRPLQSQEQGNRQDTSINEEQSAAQRHLQNQKANPLTTKGQYLTPSEWDKLCICNPNVLVIDTRNTYEIDIGTFETAVDPKTKHFAEFPQWLDEKAGEYDWKIKSGAGDAANDKAEPTGGTNNDEQKKPPPEAIAMFCTGGIRCEKATSYALQSKLFPKDVPIYHLEGGILAYLDYVAKKKEESTENDNIAEGGDSESNPPESTFRGECFVFDKRVSVTEGLKPSKNFISCYGCRGPMDRRLLLPPGENEKNEADSSNTPANATYNALTAGITRNLPTLRYDSQTHQHYLPGLTCPRCHGSTTKESLERFAARKEQMEICSREGKEHFRDGKKLEEDKKRKAIC
eukprot:scaffold358_cov207-Alexandrium_tamarense.AAC.12